MSVVRVPSADWARAIPADPGADADELAHHLAGARPWTVLTGAGMSTASGIPDYRGPDGTRRVQPMTIQQFRSGPEARRRYWARSYVGWRRLNAAAPNAAHRAVAALQRAGVFGAVITQNVDGLHQAGGARQVVELHGSLARVVCEHCGSILSRASVDAMMDAANPGFAADSGEIRPDGDISLQSVDVERFVPPLCPTCRHDHLRPDVVFFGDSVPPARVDHCHRQVEAGRGLVVLGSSLAVMSGLRFVRAAARRGQPVILVTTGPSRADELINVRSHRPVETVLPQVVRRLRGSR